MQPTCGDEGTFVLLSVTHGSLPEGDKATFSGGGEVSGRRSDNTADDRTTLGVNVPAGSVTGPVTWNGKALGTFTIPCQPDAGQPDVATDAPAATAPAGGVVKVNASASGLYAQAAIDMSESDVITKSAADEYALAAGSLAVGTCSAGPWSPPAPPAQPIGGADVGPNLEIRDGATTLATLTKGTDNIYQGNGNMGPAFGKTLSLGAPGATTIMPNVIGNVITTPTAGVTITEPTGTGAVMTQGQPFLMNWTGFLADTFVVTFPGNDAYCRLDPMAGTFSIPGATTQMLKVGTFQTALFNAINRRTSVVKINGVDKTIRGYATSAAAATYTVQ